MEKKTDLTDGDGWSYRMDGRAGYVYTGYLGCIYPAVGHSAHSGSVCVHPALPEGNVDSQEADIRQAEQQGGGVLKFPSRDV